MKQTHYRKGTRALAGLVLLALVSAMAGCTPIVSKPLPEIDVQQMPTSQDTRETRTFAPYILDVGDEVSIRVWGFEEFSKTASINNVGEINYPLLGRFHLAGKTALQTQEMLTARLKKYIVDPQVDVTTTTSRQAVIVLGEVSSPGRQAYGRPLTMMEAISRAGWFNLNANKSRVLLIRRADDRYHVYEMDARPIFVDGGKVPTVYMQPGDIVYVLPSTITNIIRFMSDVQAILQPFMTVEQMVVLWPAFKNALRGAGTGLSISTPTGTTTGTSQ